MTVAALDVSSVGTVIETARRDGCARITATELFSGAYLDQLQQAGETFLSAALAMPDRYNLKKKPWLMLSRRLPLAPDHPLRQAVGRVQAFIAAIADDPMVCFGAEFWVTVPSMTPYAHSQVWHRDREAATEWKLFLPLRPIGVEQGPLEYVRGSHRGDEDLCPRQSYPTHEIAVPADRVMTCTGPAGVGVVANTAGIHRGGRMTAGVRLQAVWIFLPATAQPWSRPMIAGGR